MKRGVSKWASGALLGIVSAALVSVALFAPQASEARKKVTFGTQIRFCENQTERWTTPPSHGNDKFFHQEMVLGEGSYSISMIPNGNFTMNAFVYGGDNNHFLGGRKNVRSYTHNFRVGGWSGEKFLIQLVKLQEGCRGCSVTMVLKARNCPRKSNATPPSTARCSANQCYKDALWGLGQCVAKRGARGGTCGTPGN